MNVDWEDRISTHAVIEDSYALHEDDWNLIAGAVKISIWAVLKEDGVSLDTNPDEILEAVLWDKIVDDYMLEVNGATPVQVNRAVMEEVSAWRTEMYGEPVAGKLFFDRVRYILAEERNNE